MKAFLSGILLVFLLLAPPGKTQDNVGKFEASLCAGPYIPDPTQWSICIFQAIRWFTPTVSFDYDGKQYIMKDVGACIKGKNCYGYSDPRSSKRFIFAIPTEASGVKIYKHGLTEVPEGVFVHFQGKPSPRDEFQSISSTNSNLLDIQKPRSYRMVFMANRFEREYYKLIYEYVRSSPGNYQASADCPTKTEILGMTLRVDTDMPFNYHCQPVVPPEHIVTRVTIFDGENKVFDANVHEPNPPFLWKLVEKEQAIYFFENGAPRQDGTPSTPTPPKPNVVHDKQPKPTERSAEESSEHEWSFVVTVSFDLWEKRDCGLKLLTEDGDMVLDMKNLKSIPLSATLDHARMFKQRIRFQGSVDPGSSRQLKAQVYDWNTREVLFEFKMSDSGDYHFDSKGTRYKPDPSD